MPIPAAVAAPFHDVPVVEGFEVAVVADRGPGRSGQDRLEMGVAVAGFAGSAFPGRFVVAGADPGPGGQVGGVGEELGDVGADLGDDRGCGQRADARDGDQQFPGGLKRASSSPPDEPPATGPAPNSCPPSAQMARVA